MTECSETWFAFQPLGTRAVNARFDGGYVTSDGGALLLREVEHRLGILRRLAACFTDHRTPERIEYTVEELIKQRVYALALGYEDLNDHDQLRREPLLAMLVGKSDPTGQERRRRRDCGNALAGKSTLNRLELCVPHATPKETRYKKILIDPEAVDRVLVELFLEAQGEPPSALVLDLDATDDPVHGHQEDRFFHGYYGHYCYLPLYIFAGEFLLCARLRPANRDASAGALEEVQRIVGHLRTQWPAVQITLRADAGFCREPLMAWCEEHGLDYVFGLAKNARLLAAGQRALAQAQAHFLQTGQPARVFTEFRYRTLESWTRERRVVAKAEHLEKGANPRFVVTSLPPAQWTAQALYEELYCARGDMENRIKEQQRDLFADRTSTAKLWSNQIRLYFSSFAYVLLHALRRLGLRGTEMAHAQCSTIRLHLLKIGALLTISVRRIRVALASGYPYATLFQQVYTQLRC
jgi:hypothetical protein